MSLIPSLLDVAHVLGLSDVVDDYIEADWILVKTDVAQLGLRPTSGRGCSITTR